MVLPADSVVAPVTSKPYDLPLKHHKFIKEELTGLLEVGLIERSLSPYTVPIIVVPCKALLWSSLRQKD